ncbi:tetratricopeptide repeat protein [Prosthecochloris sp. GSB1]|uniref:tetratricopeptide repeat protein n=1 Tax=Prosthecochloris sp. GSB1 TaxID=281093 RepID=UPI001F2E7C9E|nr:tetratricopeptide repeat protein [Prosthecochloris sp. GSB1]
MLLAMLTVSMAVTLWGCDESAKEINDLQQAVWQNPDDAQNYVRLGNAYSRKQQYDDAVDAYEKALALKPETGRSVYPALGAAYFNRQNYVQALDYFEKSLEYAPDDSLRHYDIGNVYLQMERCDKAIDAYGKAIAHSEAFAEAYYNLAICYIRTNREEQAREILSWLQEKNNYLAVSLERHLEKGD